MSAQPIQPTSELTIEQLVKLAADWAQRAGDSQDTDVCTVKVTACLDIARIKLATTEQEIRSRQIDLTREANSLTEKLLKSNEEASKQSEKNAELMNKATQQLAKSTNLLNLATWALVAFTAVQALIAIASFFKK